MLRRSLARGLRCGCRGDADDVVAAVGDEELTGSAEGASHRSIQKAETNARRHKMRRRDGADGVIARITDEQISECVKCERCRLIESRCGADAVDKAWGACRPCDGGHRSVFCD